MKKMVFLSVTLFVSFFLYQEETVSPIVKLRTEEINQVQAKTHSLKDLVGSRSAKAVLDVPPIKQLPELYNGCEVTSLSMLLTSAGYPIDKMELAEKVRKDPTPFQGTSLKQISQWGDPLEGFVGDIKGKRKGYGVYHKPLYDLLKEYMPDMAVDLTGRDFSALEWAIDQGSPVVAWTTVSFQPTNQWVTWKKDDRTIKATFQEHAVLLVGFDEQHVYLNDPLTGAKGFKVSKQSFMESWKQLGSQALTLVDEKHLYVFQH